MHDFKSKMRVISRRIAHLRTKVDDNEVSPKSASYDRAEMTALSDLLRVAAVYNDARGPQGSHVENTLYLVRDVIDDLRGNSESLDNGTQERLKSAWEKVNESILVIRKMADADAKKDP